MNQRLKVYLNSTNFHYLHLSDGGVSDNLGVRLYLDNVAMAKADPQLVSQAAVGRIKKVVFILSNTFVQHETSWDKGASSPHAIPILAAADARTMERYSEDTVLWLKEMLNDFKNQQKLTGEVEIYFIELDFKKFANPALAEYFLSLPTSFNLFNHVVDELKKAAKDLLKENHDFNALIKDLGATYAPKP